MAPKVVVMAAVSCILFVYACEGLEAQATDIDTAASPQRPPFGCPWRPCPPQVIQPNGLVSLSGLRTSCKNIEAADPDAPSGEYYIKIASNANNPIKVYCEMGLHGGGYTFLHPTALAVMTDADVQSIFTDRKSFVMRYRESNGRQSYSLLQQLLQYSSTDLKVGLNQNTGYASPVNSNAAHLGPKYLYFGFLPANMANSNTQQGLRVNGHAVTFRNCDRNPNSYMALFPNFEERTPSTYGNGWSWGGPVCAQVGSLRRHTSSSRAMPVDYFMFTEMHFGGCGCYGSTDHRSTQILATSIGFR